MKHSVCFGAAIAFGLMASPAFAQPSNPPPDRDPAAMHQDAMHQDAMHHDVRHDDAMARHDRMSMRGRMSDARMARWCHSMSYRRMMRNPRCRMMMHMHHHSDQMRRM